MQPECVNRGRAAGRVRFAARSIVAATTISLAPFVFPGCSPPRSETETGRELSEPAGADRAIEAALADSTDVWLARPGVTGTALGACDGAPCIVIYVTDERAAARFPDRVAGHPIDVRVTGRIRALDRDSA